MHGACEFAVDDPVTILSQQQHYCHKVHVVHIYTCTGVPPTVLVDGGHVSISVLTSLNQVQIPHKICCL